MRQKELPKFIIYQPNKEEFYICFEVKDKYLRWSSPYPPTQDVRFAREVTRIDDVKIKDLPKKKVFDKGTYTVTRKDTKTSAMEKLQQGTGKKTFAFILNGNKLEGRFAFKRVQGGTVLQKYKDKYATEEDVLSADLSRTIHNMIPDYDPSKITLGPSKKYKAKKTVPEEELPEAEEITADKTIGRQTYHFAFYTAEDEPDICLVTNDAGDALILLKHKHRWMIQANMKRLTAKEKGLLETHAEQLFSQ